jgi:hypothetical protein
MLSTKKERKYLDNRHPQQHLIPRAKAVSVGRAHLWGTTVMIEAEGHNNMRATKRRRKKKKTLDPWEQNE